MGRRSFGRDRQLDQVQASLAELEASVAGIAKRLGRHIEDTTHRFHRLFPVLERMAGDEVGNRRRLHGSLRLLQHQLIDALFGVPSDWSLVRRMLRIGYLDQVVCDFYPSYRAAAEAG